MRSEHTAFIQYQHIYDSCRPRSEGKENTLSCEVQRGPLHWGFLRDIWGLGRLPYRHGLRDARIRRRVACPGGGVFYSSHRVVGETWGYCVAKLQIVYLPSTPLCSGYSTIRKVLDYFASVPGGVLGFPFDGSTPGSTFRWGVWYGLSKCCCSGFLSKDSTCGLLAWWRRLAKERLNGMLG